MGRKTSIVWNHFTIPALFPKKALCNYCRQLVCRGQTNLGTTSLMNHLKRCNEFKATVLGLPKGVNDIMTDVFTGNPAGEQLQQVRNHIELGANSEEVVAEFHSISDEEVSNRAAAQTIREDTSMNSSTSPMPFLSHKVTDSPSLVARQSWAPSSKKAVKEYRNNGRPSMLLYGDISSTSEEEEPSSSNVCEPDTSLMTASVDNLTNYMASNSTVNFVHGGFMLHIMYEQYKSGKFCDLHIIPQKVTNEATISETGKIVHGVTTEKKNSKISVHACLMTAVSRKINTLVEMGCTSVQLKKGGSEAVKGLIEIIYTGKLDKIRLYSELELGEILEVAKFLEVDLAVQYLTREIPEPKPKLKSAKQRELFNEQMLTLPQHKRPMPSLVDPGNLASMRSHESSWKTTSHRHELHGIKRQKLSISDNTHRNVSGTHPDIAMQQENLHNQMIRQRLIARLLPKSSNDDDETITELYDDDKGDFLDKGTQPPPKLEYFDQDDAENHEVFAHLKTDEEEVASRS